MTQSMKSIALLLAGTTLLSAATHMAIYSPTQTVAHKLVTIDSVTFSAAADSMIVTKKDGRFAYAVASIDSIRYRTAPDRMTFIPAKNSTFKMGYRSLQGGASDEKPKHDVQFTYDFFMDTTEVTQKQYLSIVPPAFPKYDKPRFIDSRGRGDNHPAYDISWYFAVLYCNELSKREGKDTVYSYTGFDDTVSGMINTLDSLTGLKVDYSKNGYRLATEAEWEYSAYANVKYSQYWFPDSTEKYAVYSLNSLSLGENKPGYGTQPVGSKLPNNFGLYDMAGNVEEWTTDVPRGYDLASQVDPFGYVGYESKFKERVLRGGSWKTQDTYLRHSYRNTLTIGPRWMEEMPWGIRPVLPVRD